MLVHSLNKENASLPSLTRNVLRQKTANQSPTPTSPTTSTPTTARTRRRVGRASNIHRAEKVAAASLSTATKRARTLSPPVSKIGTPIRVQNQSPQLPLMDVAMDVDMSGSSSSPLPPIMIQLGRYRFPSRLLRPVEKEHPMELLKSVSEDLAEVPLEYTRDSLRPLGPLMLQALKQSKIQLRTEQSLAKELEVTIDTSVDMAHAPSHILAVFPRPSSKTPTSPTTPNKVTLHLAHALPLAAHCSALPASALALKATQTIAESTSWTLPVIPLALPDSTGWGILMGYLYTSNIAALLSSLLPIPVGAQLADMEVSAIAAHLAQTYSTPALAGIAHKVHGLWANAITLGVYDDRLWDVVDLCWAAVIEAFQKISLGGAGGAKGKGRAGEHS